MHFLTGQRVGDAGSAGGQQGGPDGRPHGLHRGGPAPQQGDRLRLLPRDICEGEHRSGSFMSVVYLENIVLATWQTK